MRLLRPALLACLVPLAACDFLIGDEGEEPGPGTPVDLLIVIDNSDSMQLHATELARAFDTLDAALDDAGVTEWRAGITTSSVYFDDGATADIDPGEAGTLVGGTTVETTAALRQELVCRATCWDNNMPSTPDYVCGDEGDAVYSEEYLDCMCGADVWRNNCGAGQEQPLEAAFLAMCRAVESPPEACYRFPSGAAAVFGEGDEKSNPGLGGRDVVVVIVSDEGDSSLRTESGDPAVPGDVEIVVNAYTTLLAAFPDEIRVSVVGPGWDGADGSCLLGAQEWGVERYLGLATNTGGVYEPLTDLATDCADRPMDTILATIAAAAVP